uniref:Uncharacterized protein n=1 Tax=Kalanchoe fedtschenkoi TaxID=63787 RepID=A0A7N0VIY4_KALFE
MGSDQVRIFPDQQSEVAFSTSGLSIKWNPNPSAARSSCGLFFASVSGKVGDGFGVTANPNPNGNSNGNANFQLHDLTKDVSKREGFRIVEVEDDVAGEGLTKKKKRNGIQFKVKIANASLRRLVSGAIAGAVSRTAVAPLETVRTHLMVGSSGNSSAQVFNDIMKNEGWKGLFRGNFVNVIRVAPSKAIELFAYDTVNRFLSTQTGEQPKILIPASLVAGACAGVSSTLTTYPLELVKTRLTIQRDVYNGVFDAFVKILQEGGPAELYRGLTPSVIGVIPYAATNYFAYDTLRRAYKKIFKTDRIGNIETLLIGSAAGTISSSATFPLEVARKHMQVGAVSGRAVYRNVLHALASILEQEGVKGLYKGLGPSCVKLVPAAGISFMCYEACKRILVEKEDDEQ